MMNLAIEGIVMGKNTEIYEKMIKAGTKVIRNRINFHGSRKGRSRESLADVV